MTFVYFAAALFILLTLAGGLLRVLRGPGGPDRLMAAQLAGSGGIAVLLLLAAAMEQPAIIDVALMLGILAVFTSIGFVNWRERSDD